MTRASLLFLALCAAACGGSGGGGDPGGDAGPSDPLDGVVTIDIAPANATVTIEGDTPATLAYTATGHFADGSTRDVTAALTWSLDDVQLGSFDRAAYTSRDTGGATVVRARRGTAAGQTTLTAIVKRSEPVSEGVGGDGATPTPPPANAGDLFDGPASTDPAQAPRIVYPGSGVLLPPNLGRLEIHFRPGAGNTVFALSFKNQYTDITLFMTCGVVGAGCVYQPSPTVWTWLAETNRGRGPLAVSVRATDDAGSRVATSEPTALEFSLEDLRGAIYYWSTSLESILRWDFASTTQTEAEVFFDGRTSTNTSKSCVGCHALSRDGSRITVQQRGQDSGDQFLLDVATREPLVSFPAPEKAVFTSWSPDGDHYVGVYDDGGDDPGVDRGSYINTGANAAGDDDQLLIIDGTTGQRTGVVHVGATDVNPVNHPDWSPLGDKIAFVSVGDDDRSLQKFHNGRVGYVQKTGDTWGSPVWLTEQGPGKNRYYPAFSPDGEFIAYDESTCPAGSPRSGDCNADTDSTATLTFARAAPGAPSIVGTNANRPGIEDGADTALANSFPKWCPFEFRRGGEQNSRLMWITFSSSRVFGLRPPPRAPNTSESPVGTLVWMAAVDPDAVARGEDPTFVPFVLPFQNITTSNHIAQWAEEAPPDID